MNLSDKERLHHIATHCDDIAAFIKRFGDDYETFSNDRAYMNAVAMCILQIGELANGLSEEYRRETAGQIPWSMIRGMRNWLAHAYAEVDEQMMWDTAKNDIPMLAEFCRSEIAKARTNQIKAEQKPQQEKTHTQIGELER